MKYAVLSLALVTSGCASQIFNPAPMPNALSYYEVKPYLLVTTDAACVAKVEVISIPGAERSVEFKNGIGSSDLGVTLQNGIITAVNAKANQVLPDVAAAASTLPAIAALGAARRFGAAPASCGPSTKLYPIQDGNPDLKHPITF